MAADASFDSKRAANIAPPLFQRESLLRRGVPDAQQPVDDETVAGGRRKSARYMVRLIESALPHALERERHRDDDAICCERRWC